MFGIYYILSGKVSGTHTERLYEARKPAGYVSQDQSLCRELNVGFFRNTLSSYGTKVQPAAALETLCSWDDHLRGFYLRLLKWHSSRSGTYALDYHRRTPLHITACQFNPDTKVRCVMWEVYAELCRLLY